MHLEDRAIAVIPESESHCYTLILEVDNEVRTLSGVNVPEVTPEAGDRLLIEGSIDDLVVRVF